MRKFWFLAALCLVVSLAGAQDAPAGAETPFMRALSLIPDIGTVRSVTPMFSYADYHAAITARGNIIPESLDAYLEDQEAYGPLFPALTTAGPSALLQNLLRGGPEYPETVGFDFFQIAQAIALSEPPYAAQILIGDFDAGAITAAYIARGYTVEQESDAGVLLCPADGCDSGPATDLTNRLPGNPFGGDLGRTEPIFVGDGVLLNSPSLPNVTAMTAVYNGTGRSLADATEFQAVANLLAEYPTVSAVIAASPLALGTLDPRVLSGNAELAEQIRARIGETPLPPYLLAAFASTADEANEYGLAILVVGGTEAAETAAAVIDDRLESFPSMHDPGRTFADILSAIGTVEPAQVVEDEATGLALVVVRVSREMPANEPDDLGLIPGSHIAFRRFYDMLIRNDLIWLYWGGAAADDE